MIQLKKMNENDNVTTSYYIEIMQQLRYWINKDFNAVKLMLWLEKKIHQNKRWIQKINKWKDKTWNRTFKVEKTNR